MIHVLLLDAWKTISGSSAWRLTCDAECSEHKEVFPGGQVMAFHRLQ